jgi:dipeptidyl-peptidase-3
MPILHLHRLGITQHLIKSGIARLEEVRGANGKLENLYIRVSSSLFVLSTIAYSRLMQVDRELVLTKGREVAGKLLVELQVRKSTADGPGAREYYTQLTKPISGWEGEIRDLVLEKKQVWARLQLVRVFINDELKATQNLYSTEYFHCQR